jgi:abhydrolase domain-containing protein 17
MGKFLWGEWSVKRLMTSIFFIYVALALFAYFFSERLIFRPPAASYQETDQILKLTTADRVQISATYLPHPQATYTVLYSHGNGSDLGDVLPTLQAIQAIGFSVFAYEYRGYGTSQGTPSEQGTYRDIDSAYAYLTETLRIPPDRILLYGWSVGGGPSVDLATRKPIGGLILEGTFTSTFVVMTQIPLFPFDRFNNLSKIPQVRCPILIIHGTDDRVIPFTHSQKLLAAANEPKRFLGVQGADHHNLIQVGGAEYAQALTDFARLVSQSRSSISQPDSNRAGDRPSEMDAQP